MATPFGYNFTLILVVSIRFFTIYFCVFLLAFLGKVDSPCLQLLRMEMVHFQGSLFTFILDKFPRF